MTTTLSTTNPIAFIGGISNITDDMEIKGIKGEEGFSKSFHFTLQVVTKKSFTYISCYIGDAVGIKIEFNEDKRYIHGVITEIVQDTTDKDFLAREKGSEYCIGTRYTLKIESKLTLLQKNISCQVHSAKKAMDVVFDILKKYNIIYDSSRLSCDNSAVQARVQYNQSDYDFISEILQSVGVFYCFEHSEDKHIMVFYDSISQLYEPEEKNYTPSKIYESYGISELKQAQRLVPSSVGLNGYHFENNIVFSLEESVKLKEQKNTNICHYSDSFINNQDELNRQLKFRASHFSITSTEGRIISNSPSIAMGKRFKLKFNRDGDAEKIEIEIDYFISEIRLSASNDQSKIINNNTIITDSIFSAELTIHPDAGGTCYSPPFKVCRQLISGTLSAFVVGSEKEDIHTDEYGRIQIRFLWQPEKYGSEFNKHEYCWARVSQVWSGRDMGGQFIPRVGSEVLISFLNGDPNYPIVTGGVFNGNYKPPFDLENPQTKTCSGIVSHNINEGSQTSGHQLCFQDMKGEEFILLQSQKDLFLKTDNDATLTVMNGNYIVTVEKGKIMISGAGEIDVSSKKGIALSVEGSHINIEPEKIKIFSPVVEISAKSETTLSAEGKTEVSARGSVNIHGAEVKLN